MNSRKLREPGLAGYLLVTGGQTRSVFWATCAAVLILGVMLVAGCDGQHYDTYYSYGATSLISTGGPGANRVEFNPKNGAEPLFVKYFSEDVFNLRTFTESDAREHSHLRLYIKDDGMLIAPGWRFDERGQLDFLYIDCGPKGNEVQLATSPQGPFTPQPMSNSTMLRAFGTPKKVTRVPVQR